MAYDIQAIAFHTGHCFCQNVTGNRLCRVLHQPAGVGFLSGPFVVLPHSFIGQAHPSEAVRLQSRLQIRQLSSRRKQHPKRTGIKLKRQLANLLSLSGLERLRCRLFHIPPILDNLRIGFPPGIDDLRQFLFFQTHLQSTHADECTGRTAITAG